jgi:hypothetical protein
MNDPVDLVSIVAAIVYAGRASGTPHMASGLSDQESVREARCIISEARQSISQEPDLSRVPKRSI